MNNNFQNLIAKYKLPQVEVAHIMDISRPTVAKILSGGRELRMSEAEKLATFIGISVNEIFGGVASTKIILEESVESFKDNEQEIRISVPIKNVKKFKNALLYITQKIGAFPNVGQTVLYKLLYFCDFDYYEKYEEQLIGATYIKNHYGPTPREFSTIVKDMIKNGEIEEVKTKFFNRSQKKYIPVIDPDLSVFTGRELQHIEDEITRLGHKTAKELSDFSHEDVPWITTNIGEDISYEAVFYRTKQTSVRTYEEN
ncbi:MAG: transcriptional regulator with XRE-family HTH domain [Rickettsiales bacterium]|jgi:transcriptional regulator with XRE-family HTH domain